MEISEAIRRRYSCRAFLDKQVSRKTLEEIMETVRWSPSGANMQPWEVAIVTGKTRRDIISDLVKTVEDGQNPRQEFNYYPEVWEKPFKTRRFKCGMALYSALGIKKKDNQRRKQQWLENYKFFNAPAALFFFLDKKLSNGALIDIGIFLQSLMLSARFHGLETCLQASLGYYPDIVKSRLNIPDAKKLLCGMSIGYPDLLHPVNQFRTEREPLSSFTTWFD